MTSITGAQSPLSIEYLTDNTYSVIESTGQGRGRVPSRRVNEALVNEMLAAYGLKVVGGSFQAADGMTLDSTNTPIVTNFGDAPPLPDTMGPIDNTSLSNRIGWLASAGDGALMWMALSEMARTAMRDMKDAKDVKRAMQQGKIEGKKAQIKSTESQLEAEREEAARAFRDAVITAVIVCAISCAAAGASASTNAATSAAGTAISATANAVGQVYQAYQTNASKQEGPQRKADDARLKAMRWEQQAEMMDQMVEEAQNNYEESKELFKLALRILTEHYELQTQVIQTTTRG